MKRVWISLGIIALAGAHSAEVLAQPSMPSAVRTNLAGYVGTWSFDEQVKDTPAGAERTVTGTWEARWVYDSLIEWRVSDSDGKTGIEFEGYDPLMQNYTYWFNSDGSRGRAYDGEWDGNTLRIQFVETSPNGETSRGRCTWPYNASFTALPDYTCEKLTAGKWWIFRSGSATKGSG